MSGYNPELLFLSLVIETGEFKPVVQFGLREEMFTSSEARAIFNWISRYYRGDDTRNLVPTWEMFYEVFPRTEMPEAPVRRITPEAMCRDLMNRWLGRSAITAVEMFQEGLDELSNPELAVETLIHDLRVLRLRARKGRDVILSEHAIEAVERYMEAKNSTSLPGIPFPQGWGYHNNDGSPKILASTGRQDHPFNEQTRGMNPEDLIIIYGRPKSMKTWILVDMATECFYRHHCKVLIFTKEMTPSQVQDRINARMAQVNYGAMRSGQLSDVDESFFLGLMTHLKEDEARLVSRGHDMGMLITSGWDSVSDDVDFLLAKADEFEPDIIFVDAAYLMEEASGNKSQRALWERVTGISRTLKKIGGKCEVPVVATTQANRNGEESLGSNVAEIAYSDAFGQDCTLAIRVIKILQEERDDAQLALIVPAAREFNLAGILLDAMPAEYFKLAQVYRSQSRVKALIKAEAEMVAKSIDEEAAAIVNQMGRGRGGPAGRNPRRRRGAVDEAEQVRLRQERFADAAAAEEGSSE